MTSHIKPPKIWPVQDAKARFSEFLDASITEGPQIVSKRGEEKAVLVSIEEWRRLEQNKPRRTLKELLLAEHPRFDFDIPRLPFNRRPPINFDD